MFVCYNRLFVGLVLYLISSMHRNAIAAAAELEQWHIVQKTRLFSTPEVVDPFSLSLPRALRSCF